MTRIFVILCYTLLFFHARAQCDFSWKPVENAGIWAPNPIFLAGPDTLRDDRGRLLIYSCETCTISGTNPHGTLRWTRDISEYGCQLLAYNFMYTYFVNTHRVKKRLFLPPRLIYVSFEKGGQHLINPRTGDLYKLKTQ